MCPCLIKIHFLHKNLTDLQTNFYFFFFSAPSFTELFLHWPFVVIYFKHQACVIFHVVQAHGQNKLQTVRSLVTQDWRMLVSLGQVSLSFYLMEFVYSKEYTTTLFWLYTILFKLSFGVKCAPSFS